MTNSGRIGSSLVRVLIHAPPMPSVTSTSGATQQSDAPTAVNALTHNVCLLSIVLSSDPIKKRSISSVPMYGVNMKSLTIAGFAAAVEVNVETIRFYQRRGLLTQPVRPLGGIRRYDSKDVSRVRFIKSAQRIGFKLDEIAQLLRLDDGTHCAEAREIAEHKLIDVRLRLSDLRNIEASLSDLVRRCKASRGKVACPLIASLHVTELQ